MVMERGDQSQISISDIWFQIKYLSMNYAILSELVFFRIVIISIYRKPRQWFSIDF
jgi:hypothetical protein